MKEEILIKSARFITNKWNSQLFEHGGAADLIRELIGDGKVSFNSPQKSNIRESWHQIWMRFFIKYSVHCPVHWLIVQPNWQNFISPTLFGNIISLHLQKGLSSSLFVLFSWSMFGQTITLISYWGQQIRLDDFLLVLHYHIVIKLLFRQLISNITAQPRVNWK